MSLIVDLQFRGLVHQATDPDKLAEWLAAAPRTLYAGFDPTADSLHIGHLVALTTLRRFQRAGHRPIALVGGATGMIGDPSGQSKERNLLSPETLAANVAGMRGQIARFLDFEGPRGALLVNNFDWMQGYSYLTFLRDVGKCFPVNVMLAKDSVKARLERTDSGLSYTEFSYMLLQAYDFVHLHRSHGCELQIGGSDQWGNITAGIELARRLDSAHLEGMTTPLLVDSEGKKMGKTSEGKTVWLAAERTSEYEFYQYWLNVADADVETCLKFFTDLSAEEITALAASRAADAGKRESQNRLAEEVTRLIHGEAGLERARNATQSIRIGASQIDDSLVDQLPTVYVSLSEFMAKLMTRFTIVDALELSGAVGQRSEAKRLVKQGGAYLGDIQIRDENFLVTPEHLSGDFLAIRTGKKDTRLICLLEEAGTLKNSSFVVTHVSEERAQYLNDPNTSFSEILKRCEGSLEVVDFRVEEAKSKELAGCSRPIIGVKVPPRLFDMFFNSTSGYRAQYLGSTSAGENANREAVATLLRRVELRLDNRLTTRNMTISLSPEHARAWIQEDSLLELMSQPPKSHEVVCPFWEANIERHTPRFRDLARRVRVGLRAPIGSVIEIKGAWIDRGGMTRVPSQKRSRSLEIHMFGFT